MGYRVKEAREAQNMTQQELADKSGVSRVTISLIESGKARNALSSTVLKLANALGKSVEDIFFADSVKPT